MYGRRGEDFFLFNTFSIYGHLGPAIRGHDFHTFGRGLLNIVTLPLNFLNTI